MRKVILLMHVSLDGFTAGPNGELDWIVVDDEIWKDVIDLQRTADAALFGRVNYQGFESYWPSVVTKPSATPNEVDHALTREHDRLRSGVAGLHYQPDNK